MCAISVPQGQQTTSGTGDMRAAVFERPGHIGLQERPVPGCGPTDAIVKVTLTTICGTDVHIWREEYPVAPGRIIGHEPVGVIHALGEAVSGYEVGDRVLVGAITPCGSCFYCQNHIEAQCSGHDDELGDDRRLAPGQLDRRRAGRLLPRPLRAGQPRAKIPDDLTDEQCVLLADIASTGISAAETADVQIGQTVAVFAQGPIGLCATAGARLKGASLIIGVDAIEKRLNLSREMGADEVIDFTQEDPVAAIKRLTGGRGVDVAIEALGKQQTFQWCLEATRPGGIVSSLGVYGGKLEVPLEPFVYGIGDKKILTTLCPGGKERMRKLMELVRHGRLDLVQLITHRFALDQIEDAYELFGNQRDGVVKVAHHPLNARRAARSPRGEATRPGSGPLQEAWEVFVGPVLGHPADRAEAARPGGEPGIVIDADDDDAKRCVDRTEAGEHVAAVVEEPVVDHEHVHPVSPERLGECLTRADHGHERHTHEIAQHGRQGLTSDSLEVGQHDAHVPRPVVRPAAGIREPRVELRGQLSRPPRRRGRLRARRQRVGEAGAGSASHGDRRALARLRHRAGAAKGGGELRVRPSPDCGCARYGALGRWRHDRSAASHPRGDRRLGLRTGGGCPRGRVGRADRGSGGARRRLLVPGRCLALQGTRRPLVGRSAGTPQRLHPTHRSGDSVDEPGARDQSACRGP